MDSGNSGSFQSSSGEDDDFDFSAHSNHHQQPPPPPPPPPETTSSSNYMYHNPLSNYFDLVSLPQPPQASLHPLHIQNHNDPENNNNNNNALLIDYDIDWLKTLRSPNNQLVDENTTTDAATLLSPPPPPPPPPTTGKNPRKRSRTSRRAPTTVLTTDTSNFRAMVQEFTGIPASPFTSSSTTSSSSATLLRHRFDLLGGRANYNPNPLLTQCFNVPDNRIVCNTSGYSSTKKSHQESPNDSHMNMGGGLDEYSYRVSNQIYSQDHQTTKRTGNNNQDDVSSWQMINEGMNTSQH